MEEHCISLCLSDKYDATTTVPVKDSMRVELWKVCTFFPQLCQQRGVCSKTVCTMSHQHTKIYGGILSLGRPFRRDVSVPDGGGR